MPFEIAFHALPLGAVRPRGWMLAQMRRDLEDGFAGRLDALTARAAHDLFRERIGSSDDYMAWWDAETRGNWLWGYVMMASLADLPAHRQRAGELVDALLATRDADGYIGIYGARERYGHAEGENAELWAQSRALLPLVAWYEATRDGRVLLAVVRAVHAMLGHYREGSPYFRRGKRIGRDEITGLTHGLCYLDVLERLHEATGEAVYAEAGARLYREFSGMPRPFQNDDMALPSLADPKRLFTGHAVHTAEHLRAVLFAHQVAPEEVPDEIVESALDRLGRFCVPSGALVGDESVHGMPMPESAYEFCTSTELALSLESAVQKLGRAALGDWLETLLFNAVQGARLPDGSAIAYLSADTRLFATADRPDSHAPGKPGRRFKYSPTHDDVACCCNPNAVRVLPQYVKRMWARTAGGDGLAAIAYGPSELRSTVGDVGVRILEETSYPFADEIAFHLHPDRPVEFTLVLRRPAWAERVDVSVAGAEPVERDGWVRIRKTWNAGDAVRLAFATKPRLQGYANGEAAVLRGPIQYVLPLEHRLEAIRLYKVPGFKDWNVVPVDLAHGYRIPVLDERSVDVGFALESRAADPDRPWDAPLHVLKRGDSTLVPMGCAPLRRAAFPVR